MMSANYKVALMTISKQFVQSCISVHKNYNVEVEGNTEEVEVSHQNKRKLLQEEHKSSYKTWF